MYGCSPVVQSSAGHDGAWPVPGGTTGAPHADEAAAARTHEPREGHHAHRERAALERYDVVVALSTAVHEAHDVCAEHSAAGGGGTKVGAGDGDAKPVGHVLPPVTALHPIMVSQ